MYLNLRKIRWLDLLKDYDLCVLYNLGKANNVADEAQYDMDVRCLVKTCMKNN